MSVLGRAAVAAVSAVALVGMMASPASAADKTLSLGAVGYMKFIDKGDIFKVCDTRAEGSGVYGTLWYDSFVTTGGYKRVFNLSDGGDKGCGRKVHDIGNGGHYVMTVCPGRYPTNPWDLEGSCTHSGGFNE
ncbi:hypothetical protein NEH83_26955 [Streptomyces sp. JUS-F4]|uniref:hypothetical protein n=1 Tax=Streptomyces sp. JUS-F4 TaxID=2951988 RepID=UPI002665ED90|nr:hypothetical protein [Streptomyces sp. JUS-F4]WKN17499.1 hypothetical protein NEH83_26955 [Streptomyces sp. JUS-F4]